MKKLYGTVVPIITPFTNEDKIDVESLENLTEYIIGGGLQCLYPCGTTGEMLLLNLGERKLVAETVLKKTADRIPVFAQVGAMTLRDTVELAVHAVRPAPTASASASSRHPILSFPSTTSWIITPAMR